MYVHVEVVHASEGNAVVRYVQPYSWAEVETELYQTPNVPEPGIGTPTPDYRAVFSGCFLVVANIAQFTFISDSSLQPGPRV